MSDSQKKELGKSTTVQKGRDPQELGDFSLGQSNTQYPSEYDPGILEAFPNKNPGVDAWTSFICTEFTSLCPKTNQPDFAKIFLNYIANEKMVESKSMKLYLFSFRNHGDFHEDCIQKICNDLTQLLSPKYLEVIGEFTPRGGIAIWPYSSSSNKDKKYLEIRQQRMADYTPGKYSTNLSKIY